MRSLTVIFISFLITVTVCGKLHADSRTDQAIKHFYEEEYEAALEILEDVFKANPESAHLYRYYLNTMTELEKFDKAESELKALESDHPEIPRFAVDLGYIYTIQGKKDEAEAQFQRILDNLTDDEQLVKTTGNALQRRGETELAIEVFERGRSLSGDDMAYKYQLADIYQAGGRYEDMFEEYLNILSDNKEFKPNVQNNIQELVMEDEELFEDYRRKLLRRVQSHPENNAYTELYSWLFIQKEDFEEAFRQLRAIDRRLGEEGERLFDLAEVAINHKAFDVAEDIYRHIASLGEEGSYYMKARQGLLEVKYHKLEEGIISDDEIADIVRAYEDHIEVFGLHYRGASEVVLRLAEIKAIYQRQPEEAIALLEEFLERGRDSKQNLARAKMHQAKYHTFIGNTWRATLLYGQIEKDFKDHPLGHEARYHNAKLSFYRGEFQWALAQLEVLKGATSDLFSNDALQLSLSIRDAVGLDTTTEALELYAEADLLIFQRRYEPALDKLDQLLERFPGHSLEENVLMAKAEIMMAQRNYEAADAYLEDLYTGHRDGVLADEALFKAARLHIDRFDNPSRGVELLEKLIFNHPDSIFTVDARQEYRRLRGDLP